MKRMLVERSIAVPRRLIIGFSLLIIVCSVAIAVYQIAGRDKSKLNSTNVIPQTRQLDYRPRFPMDASGFGIINDLLPPWKPDATLLEISEIWRGIGIRSMEQMDRVQTSCLTEL